MQIRDALLRSTALAATAIAVPSAWAADGVRLDIKGYYRAAVGGVVGEDFSASSNVRDGDLRDYAFKQNIDVSFQGETTLDNGLTVGVLVELKGQTDQEDLDQIKKVYAYFTGGFGKIQFGDQDSALSTMCYLVPSATLDDEGLQTFGADSPATAGFNFSNAGIAGYGATNGTCYGVDSYSTQVVYFTPNLAGFEFAFSFTPDHSEDTRNTLARAGTRFRNDAAQNSDNLSVAARYTRDFDSGKLILGGAHTWSFDKESNPNNTGRAQDSNAYAQLTLAGFTIGTATEYRQNFGDDGADQWVFGVGATYNWDAWTVGLGWTRGNYEKVVGVNGVGPFNAVHDDIALTAAYALGPGISLDGLLEYSRYESNDPAGPDSRGIGVGIGTTIGF